MVSLDERVEILERKLVVLEDSLVKFTETMYDAYASDIPFLYERMKDVGINLTLLHRELSNIKKEVGIPDNAKGVTIQ